MNQSSQNTTNNTSSPVFKLNKEEYYNRRIQPVTQLFKLSESTKDEIKSLKPDIGYNGLGEFVMMRTYSRGNENWNDIVIRVIEGIMSIRKEHYYRNYLEWNDEKWQSFAREMALSLFNFEFLCSGRALWLLGTPFCYERGSMCLYNCAAVDSLPDFPFAVEFGMDLLMCGTGLGFSAGKFEQEVSRPNKEDYETFVIDDSREGWTESVLRLMCSYMESPKYGKCKFPRFDYSKIREAGLPIKGFGGKSSGPAPLQKLHVRMEEFLDNFCNGYITVKMNDGTEVKKPYDHTRLVCDIFNSVGACVVAGNVRRSAEICLGDANDETFLELKNYEKNPERGDISWMSNNSVILKADNNFDNFKKIPEIAKRIIDNGEPGVVNLHNIQKYARYGDEKPDPATLLNPCSEIPLCSTETCNLSEVFPPRCKNFERFKIALEFATFYASTVCLLPTHRPETNAIISKNRRIGVSISGIAQWVNGITYPSVKSEWGNMNYTRLTGYLRDAYKIVKRENAKLAKEAGIPESIRLTTVKPSGSISLLAGTTPGVHYPVSRYAIRRVRVSMDSNLVKVLKKAGVPYEKDVVSDNTLVFEFTIDHGDVKPAHEVSLWEQFNMVALLQRAYSDNCVSATIYFDKEKEKDDIENALAMFIPQLKSISMLPHSGHGYKQAPYEPITEEVYRERCSKFKAPDYSKVMGNVPVGSKFCSGDTCEL